MPLAMLLAWELGVGNTTDAAVTLLIALAAFTLLVLAALGITYLVGRGVEGQAAISGATCGLCRRGQTSLPSPV